jgi:uncharacterized protein YndB with AHSA1/START domain
MSNKSKVSSAKKNKQNTKKISKPVAKKNNVKKNVVKLQKVSKTKSKSNVKAAIKKVSAKKVSVKKIVSKKSDKKPTLKTITKKILPKSTAKKTIPKAIKTKITKIKKVDSVNPKETLPKNNQLTKSEIKGKVFKASKANSDKKINSNVLAINNNIPKKEIVEIPLSKIESISKSITNPVKKIDAYAIKPEKEPNGKFELEFVVHSSADLLFEFLSTASGLSEWFCDDVNIRNGIYTFIWEGQMQQARLLKTLDLLLVRFQWVDKHDGSYFEFKIQRDELTNDISLIITDFAETPSEKESSTLLWNSQIEKLMHVIGSIF